MRIRIILSLLVLEFISSSANTADPPKPIAFKVARLHPASSPPIDKAILIVENGKIVAVGKQSDIQIPKEAVVHELPDAVIIPGLVDTHSHIGIWSRPSVPANVDGNESTGPV